ncbi:MAG: hypothetical protein K940chlam7_00644 [Chlamydiae bacterium]|nr:hypothetical protein [Chlamydiota bacterium]
MTLTHTLLIIFGLGLYHGINPAMGWLLATSLGFQRKSTKALFVALVVLTLGHLLSITMVVLGYMELQKIIPKPIVEWTVVFLLLTCGTYHLLRKGHRSWLGLQSSYLSVGFWSFLIATAHGAGVMLLPFLADTEPTFPVSALVIIIHSLGYLLTSSLAAVFIYSTVNLKLLKKSWINFDLIWAYSLLLTGAFFALFLIV